jgi:DNA (cytosine-5)-methyltransferase 1
MNAPRLISLYSGAGGLDYGFEAAGFETAVTLEIDHDSCQTLRASRPHWRIIERDIFSTTPEEILATAELDQGHADVLIGGPPCQPFSKAGYWWAGDSRRLGDPRANTLTAYLAVLERALPRAFLLENVHGLAFSKKDEGLRYLLEEIERINARTGSKYQPKFRVLNAASFGVPQLRERVFIVGFRDGHEFQFPEETHVDPSLPQQDISREGGVPFTTAWDAIGDLSLDPSEKLRLRGKWAGLLPSVPEGQNYLWHTDRGGGRPLFGWRRRYWSFLLKLAKSRPSWTLQAQPGPAIGPFHWKSRLLSGREMCRIQTFPDDVHVVGMRTSVQRQIGNAVPSLLAEVLARSIRSQLDASYVAPPSPRLVPSVRRPIPPPEDVADVPAEYLHLVGIHEAHPGTGLGFAATQRGNGIANSG